jgi:hypothetical protein
MRSRQVPKVIKMPMRDQHQDSEGNATSEFSSFRQAMVLPLQNESDDDLDMITRWINLADKALSGESSTRKRA